MNKFLQLLGLRANTITMPKITNEKVSDEKINSVLDSLEKITGMFDVHVTVDETEIYKLNSFVNYHNIELAFAIGSSGTHKQQLMTSMYSKGNGKEAVLYAIKIKEQMQDFGIKVLRVKIESLANNPGVAEFANSAICKGNNHYYYEFHFKVKIDTPKDQEKLDVICKKCHASYAINFLSKNRKDPLISFRCKGDYEKALIKREELINDLQNMGLKTLMDGTHYEFTIYDDNYGLDEGLVEDPVKC